MTGCTCEGDVCAGEDVGRGVGLQVVQRGGHQRGHRVQPDHTALQTSKVLLEHGMIRKMCIKCARVNSHYPIKCINGNS